MSTDLHTEPANELAEKLQVPDTTSLAFSPLSSTRPAEIVSLSIDRSGIVSGYDDDAEHFLGFEREAVENRHMSYLVNHSSHDIVDECVLTFWRQDPEHREPVLGSRPVELKRFRQQPCTAEVRVVPMTSDSERASLQFHVISFTSGPRSALSEGLASLKVLGDSARSDSTRPVSVTESDRVSSMNDSDSIYSTDSEHSLPSSFSRSRTLYGSVGATAAIPRRSSSTMKQAVPSSLPVGRLRSNSAYQPSHSRRSSYDFYFPQRVIDFPQRISESYGGQPISFGKFISESPSPYISRSLHYDVPFADHSLDVDTPIPVTTLRVLPAVDDFEDNELEEHAHCPSPGSATGEESKSQKIEDFLYAVSAKLAPATTASLRFNPADCHMDLRLKHECSAAVKMNTGLYRSVRTCASVPVGKPVYFEMFWEREGNKSGGVSFGICTKSMPLDKLLGSIGESVGFYSSGDIIVESMWESYSTEEFKPGAVIGCLVKLEALEDGTNAEIRFSINGQWVPADPVKVVFGMGKATFVGASLLSENAKVVCRTAHDELLFHSTIPQDLGPVFDLGSHEIDRNAVRSASPGHKRRNSVDEPEEPCGECPPVASLQMRVRPDYPEGDPIYMYSDEGFGDNPTPNRVRRNTVQRLSLDIPEQPISSMLTDAPVKLASRMPHLGHTRNSSNTSDLKSPLSDVKSPQSDGSLNVFEME